MHVSLIQQLECDFLCYAYQQQPEGLSVAMLCQTWITAGTPAVLQRAHAHSDGHDLIDLCSDKQQQIAAERMV
jgi:hypothetical protein